MICKSFIHTWCNVVICKFICLSVTLYVTYTKIGYCNVIVLHANFLILQIDTSTLLYRFVNFDNVDLLILLDVTFTQLTETEQNWIRKYNKKLK